MLCELSGEAPLLYSRLSNEVRRVAPHLLSVQNMEEPEFGDRLAAHPAQRNMNQLLPELPRESSEAGAGGGFA